MRKLMFLAILGLLIGGASVRACDTTCPSGQTWQWTDSKQTTGVCVAPPTGSGSSSTSNASASASSNQSQSQGQTANGGAGGSASAVDNAKNTNTSSNTNVNAPVANGGAGGSVKDSGNSSSSSNATGGSVKDSGNSTIKDSGNSSSTSGVKNSGNSASSSTLKNSGNSANSNVNNVAGSSQTQTATAENNSSGNSSSYSSTYKEAAATAMGYAAPPSATCIVTGGAGGQGIGFGFSISGGKEDKGCVILEAARNAAIYSNRRMYCIAILQHKVFKNATMEDCMQESPRPIQVVQAPAPVQVTPPTIIVPAPQVVIQSPAPSPTPVAANEGTLRNVGTCKFFNGRPTNVCYRMLDDAIRVLQASPSARLVLSGPMSTTHVLPYVDSKIARSRIELRLEDDATNNLTIATWNVE